MKRFCKIVLYVCTLGALAQAQDFTTVTGTVRDSIGLPYANGTITPVLTSTSTPVFTSTNQPYSPPTGLVQLDANGNFTMQLARNGAFKAPNNTSTWAFITCSVQGTVNYSWGKASACYQVGPITLTGSAQNISANLQNQALPLTYSASIILQDSPSPNCATLFAPVTIDTTHLDATGLATAATAAQNSTAVKGVAVDVPDSGCLGSVQVATGLVVPCITDGQSAVGDFVDAGIAACTDIGATADTGSFGQVMRANTGAGTTSMILLGGGLGGGGGGGSGINCGVGTVGALAARFDPTTIHCDDSSLTDFAGNISSQSYQAVGPHNGEVEFTTDGVVPPTALPSDTISFLVPNIVPTPFRINLPPAPGTDGQFIQQISHSIDGSGTENIFLDWGNNVAGYILQVNGGTLTAGDTVNFNNTLPSAVAGHLNLPFAKSTAVTTDSVVVTPEISGNTTKLASAGTISGTNNLCADGSGNVTTVGCTLATATLNQYYLNEGVTGTTLNKVAKLSPCNNCVSVTAVITSTTDGSSTSGVSIAGIVTAGAGTTGVAVIQYGGVAACVFDGGVTRGDAVILSTTVAGDCHDSTSPVYDTNNGSTPMIGRVNSPTNAATGTYLVDLTPIGAPEVNYPILARFLMYPNGGTFPVMSNLGQRTLGQNSPTNASGADLEVLYNQNFLMSGNTRGLFTHGRFSGDVIGSLDLGIGAEASGHVTIPSGLYSPPDQGFGASQPLSSSINERILATGSGTYSITNVNAGQIFSLEVCQDGTGHWHFGWPTQFITFPLVPDPPNACVMAWFVAKDTTHIYETGQATPIHPAALTGRTSALSDTVLAHPLVATLIHVGGSVNCTTTSAGATATLNIKYTDTASTVQTVSVTDTCTALVTTGIPNVDFTARIKADTDITYGVTIANTPTYDVDVSVQSAQ